MKLLVAWGGRSGLDFDRGSPPFGRFAACGRPDGRNRDRPSAFTRSGSLFPRLWEWSSSRGFAAHRVGGIGLPRSSGASGVETAPELEQDLVDERIEFPDRGFERRGVPLPPGRVYLSSTLLERELSALPLRAAGAVLAAHPFRLPGESDPAMRRFLAWARSRGIEVGHERLQAEAFFACLAANDALSHLGRFFIRDYALDMLDHAQGLAGYLALYPRPTLGPGQRFLAKGGYLLPIVDGQPDPGSAAWILP